MEIERGTCPACSSLRVTHVRFGLQFPDDLEPPWVRLGGCCLPDELYNRECDACGHRWWTPPPVEADSPTRTGPSRPSTRRPKPRPRQPRVPPGAVRNIEEFLAAEDCRTVEELGEKMYNTFDVDCYIYGVTDHDISVVMLNSGTGVNFPFLPIDFWRAVDELEDQVIDELEREDERERLEDERTERSMQNGSSGG